MAAPLHMPVMNWPAARATQQEQAITTTISRRFAPASKATTCRPARAGLPSRATVAVVPLAARRVPNARTAPSQDPCTLRPLRRHGPGWGSSVIQGACSSTVHSVA